MMPLPPRALLPHDRVLRAVRRHPYFSGALGIHVAVLWAASHLYARGLEQAGRQANQSLIRAHTQAAVQLGMRRRVDSLKAMSALAERMERTQAKSELMSDPASAPATRASQPPSNHQDLDQALDRARELRDQILRTEQYARARRMAEVLKLPLEQALRKIEQQAPDAATEAIRPQTPEQVAEVLDRYEQQAREALHRLQDQRAQERDGSPVQLGSAGGPASKPGGHSGSGAHPGKGSQGQDPAGAPAGLPAGGAGARADGAASGFDGRRSSVANAQARHYDGHQTSAAVDTGQLRLGTGNALGADGAWANRVYVDRWYIIGPFHAPDASSLQKIYPPELWVDLDGVYLGKNQRALRWQYVSSAAYPLIPPDPAERAIYYGYAEIRSNQERNVWMGLGADDDAKLWLNEQPVWVSGNQSKPWYTYGGVQSLRRDILARNLIEAKILVRLHRGRNTVLFKLYNNPLDVFFSLVIEPVDKGV